MYNVQHSKWLNLMISFLLFSPHEKLMQQSVCSKHQVLRQTRAEFMFERSWHHINQNTQSCSYCRKAISPIQANTWTLVRSRIHQLSLFFLQAGWWLQDSGFWLPGPKPSAAGPLCSTAPGGPGNEGHGLSNGDAIWPRPLWAWGWPKECGIWWLWHGASTHAPWRLRHYATPGARPRWDYRQTKTQVKHLTNM